MASSRTFYGWRVVSAAFVLAMFGWGFGFYGPPVFLHAVQRSHDWPLAVVSGAVTVHFLFGALVVANLPRLYRRLGVPAVTMAGAAALALGMLGWASAQTPWQLFAAALLSGSGWVAMGAAAVNAIIAPWFVRARPAALATAYNGASVGGILFAPLLAAGIARFGFPATAALFGAVMVIVVCWLAHRVFARSPEAMGQAPDGDAPGAPAPPVVAGARPLPGRQVWRDRGFLTLAAGMALGLFAQAGLLAHLFSLLVPTLGAETAGLAMGLATAAAIGGRTLVGWLMPAGADRRLVACASYGVQIAGSLVFVAAAGSSIPLLLLGVVLFGAGIGNATSLPPLIAQVEFAKEDVGRVVALAVAVGQATYAFAPLAFGLVRTAVTDGAAPQVFVAAATVQALAIAAFLLGRPCRTRRASPAGMPG
ncbi:MAG: MFS transporter [Thalassobaculum sp.]|uniref:MFS transporter n=1 Tax=Thalassobaculum sp. TaxID=2022740 RepID=UPI0032EBC171